ncbi:metallophosphoesterase [Shinella sp. CPCC 101442]|uniref:metallophosphoesterase n=1 Tax=Shinella sp. CPCC 101442 TaxID=2932265 RepID=UPI0021530960|nr:metallophosphoesterase [Shinella sp. CPCC 101442]MCR6502943.1 metallophosphoesterase [Shinella sp. CPCC 101442]
MIATVLVPLLAFLIVVAVVAYVGTRLGSLLHVRRRLYLYLITGVIIVAALTTSQLTAAWDSVIIDRVYLVSGVLLGLLFYVFIWLLVFELLRPLLRIPARAAGIAVLLLATVTTGYGVWNAYRFETRIIDITMPKLMRPINVAVLADVHMGGHRGKAYLERIVAATNAMNPDMIVVPGDLADSTAILRDENFAPLAQLKAPVYFATGNHDTYIDEKRLIAIAQRHGVRVLHNEVVSVEGLQIAGLDYMNADDKAFDLHPSPNKTTIEGTLPGIGLDPSRPSILIHHSPVGIPYAEQAGIDLFITGHTHDGGQIFPATVLAKGLFFPYSNGLYRIGKMQLFVSPGIGTFMLPLRVGSQNELTLLRLRPAR